MESREPQAAGVNSGFVPIEENQNSGSRRILRQLDSGIAQAESFLNEGALQVFERAEAGTARTEQILNNSAQGIFNGALSGFNRLAARLDSSAENFSRGLADLGRPFQPSRRYQAVDAVGSLVSAVGVGGEVAGRLGRASPLRRRALGALDAFFGTVSAVGQFSEEYDAGSRTYQKTVKRSAASVLQSSINTAVGVGVAHAVAALGVTTLGAPVVIGVGAALGVGYVTNKLINRWI